MFDHHSREERHKHVLSPEPLANQAGNLLTHPQPAAPDASLLGSGGGSQAHLVSLFGGLFDGGVIGECAGGAKAAGESRAQGAAPAIAGGTLDTGPATGLGSYKEVPDDFIGPLAPGQMRKSDLASLKKSGFGKFQVVGNDFIGPLTNKQMTQQQFDELSQGWLNILGGKGMNIEGSGKHKAKDEATFKKMLMSGMTDSPTFRNLITSIGNDTDPAHLIQAKVGRNQPGVLGDSFASNEIDLADLEKWPGAPGKKHPNQFTRNEAMVHFLSERQDALQNSSGFGPAHQHGIDVQNQYRRERGQAEVLSQTGKLNPDGSIKATVAMQGGDKETWDVTQNGKIKKITPP